jgi:hypothetical protein
MENVNKATMEASESLGMKKIPTNYNRRHDTRYPMCARFNDDKGINNLIRFELLIRKDRWHWLMKISMTRQIWIIKFSSQK